jgi:hypothetical protein
MGINLKKIESHPLIGNVTNASICCSSTGISALFKKMGKVKKKQ